MSIAGDAIGLVRELIGWGREVWRRRTAQHDQAVEEHKDIERRHVERRDLSKDKRRDSW